MEFSVFRILPIVFYPLTEMTEKSLAPSSLGSPIRYSYTLLESLLVKSLSFLKYMILRSFRYKNNSSSSCLVMYQFSFILKFSRKNCPIKVLWLSNYNPNSSNLKTSEHTLTMGTKTYWNCLNIVSKYHLDINYRTWIHTEKLPPFIEKKLQ